jgi:hypothetical protein
MNPSSINFTDNFLLCCVCQELSLEPMECSNCNNIICNPCFLTLKKKDCPICRKENFEVKLNQVVKRMISIITVNCPNNCNEQIEMGNLSKHKLICVNRNFSCKIENCGFEGTKEKFKEHIVSTHADQLLIDFEKAEKPIIKISNDNTSNNNLIGKTTNEFGKTSRLGATGKYYCGGKLTVKCGCCDGYCGTTDGCNCSACMKLDISARNLPKGYYVNKEGFACRLSQRKMYCGRKVMNKSIFCDGYCGPTDGPNCFACQVLQNLLSINYYS